MDIKEFRVLIYHCFLMKKNTVQAKAWLDKCYPTSAPSRAMVEQWFVRFKKGCTSTEDAERSGRPNKVVTPANIEKLREIVLANRKIKCQEIADMLEMSTERVGFILHEHLSMRKLYSKWVPRNLTAEQKLKRVRDAERCLELFRADRVRFLLRYATMDETWIPYYAPETQAAGEPRAKRTKTQHAAGKIRASVFWDAWGILFIDYLEDGETIDDDRYLNQLVRLKEEIAKKRLHMKFEKVLYHQDVAPSLAINDKLNDLNFQLLPHQANSPDLAPSNFYLFADLKKKVLAGKRFESNVEVIARTEAYFENKDESFYRIGIEMLEKRWSVCMSLDGDYVDE